ncbi:hypothetical protein ABH924_004829, partial [Arthrobacter sp. GAS37]
RVSSTGRTPAPDHSPSGIGHSGLENTRHF